MDWFREIGDGNTWMDLFRYISDENMKQTGSIEASWPMRESSQDRQSTLDVPVRIEVIHLWAGNKERTFT